jgi:hypothetical protein
MLLLKSEPMLNSRLKTDRLDSEFEERLNAVSDEIPVTEEEAGALLSEVGINPDECLRRLVTRIGAH